MKSQAPGGPGADDVALAVQAKLPLVNAVFILSLILTQATSPGQAMRLVITGIPTIAPGHKALAWHPTRSGPYYEGAPDDMSDELARLTGPGRLEAEGSGSWWAFPLTSPPGPEPVFLVIAGSQPLSEEETFLLSVLAQLAGTVIAKLELIRAERANVQRVATLNAELESSISMLTKIMEIHHRLNEIVANAGEAGIAETLHRLTTFPVLIQDAHGSIRAAAGEVPGDPDATEQREQRQDLIQRLRIAYRAVYDRGAWLVLANPRPGVLGVIALIDPGRTASDTDLAALEYAATVLSVELARLQSAADAELRSRTARERDIAQARAAELTASEARRRAILDAALDGVVSIDRCGRVTYVNGAFEGIFGYPVDELIGHELAELVVPPSLREAHRQGFAHYLETGQSRILDRRIEMPAMRADGSEFVAELTITRTEMTDEPVFTGYVRDITERRRAEQELVASRARLVAASDAARQRVTRDLHDGAQQRFVTTIINLQRAEDEWGPAPQHAKELLGLALHEARQGLEDLRELAAGIHPAILTQRGLAAALRGLTGTLPVPVQLDITAQRLPEPIEASIYFFCSEALTNVVKHAHARCAWVRVDLAADRCTVEVRDDGMGGAVPRSQSSGLTGLRDRIGALGGAMEVSSPVAAGTTLQAWIPLASGSAAGEIAYGI
jgi:PAS domain S-box-containing protein